MSRMLLPRSVYLGSDAGEWTKEFISPIAFNPVLRIDACEDNRKFGVLIKSANISYNDLFRGVRSLNGYTAGCQLYVMVTIKSCNGVPISSSIKLYDIIDFDDINPGAIK